jgi:signal transduction histidine kinase/response regulator of citrate/malate metabolism
MAFRRYIGYSLSDAYPAAGVKRRMISRHACLLVLLICVSPLFADSVIQVENHGLTELNGPWQIRHEPPAGLPELSEWINWSEWRSIDLPAEPDPGEREYPVFRLVREFFVPSELKEERLFLLMGKRWGAVRVYINGIEILTHGSFAPGYHYHEARRVNAPIPKGVLRYNAVNWLDIYYSPEADRTIITPPAFGFEQDYWFHEGLVNFINVDLYRYLSFLSLFVAFFYFMQFFVRPKERNNLIFALVNVGFAVYLIRLGYSFPQLPFIPFFAFSKAIFFPAVTLMTSFVARYLESTRLKRQMPYFWTVSVLSFLAILFFGRSTLMVDTIFAVSLIVVGIQIILMAVITAGAYRRGVPDTLPMLIGVYIGAVIGAHDIIYMMLRIYPVWWIQGIAIFAFDMGVFASLAMRSMRLHSELERYSEMIEQKVMDRTRELQRANTDLQGAMEAARHASQAKSRFLANISHEMRTPLNCIIGFSEMISRSVDRDQKKNLDVVLEESERLLTLINQLLDIEKIEAGKISLDAAPFNLKEFLKGIENSFAVHCAEKGLYLKVEEGEGVPELIEADSFRLRQVLDNLVSNAVKFTSRGGVTVSVKVEVRQSEQELILKFSVADTGIGIPREQSETIFESFEQGDSSRTRLYGGTGLGTTITKQLVALMKGEIGLESEMGIGSLFWFTMPCRIPVDDEFPKAMNPVPGRVELIQENPRILVVEDYRPNRVIAQAHLESLGCRVIEAVNGREAVDLAAETSFDLILMDIQMPEMDGLEATAQIRQGRNRETPIIGLTANAFPEDLRLYREAGMNGVLTKPLRREAFLSDVASWLTKGTVLKKQFYESADPTTVCDFESLIQELGEDRDSALHMVREFSKGLSEQLERIEDALETKNWDLLHRELHSLKGGGLNLFAFQIADAAGKAELAAKDSEEKRVQTELPGLKTAVESFRRYVQDLA